ncbi:MAG: hypothetical protein GX653_09285 [Clostridiales bacterium]|nr:hypothetical protein [Clostridiales bacterium]
MYSPVSDKVLHRIDQYLQKSSKYTFYDRIELLEESEPLFRDDPYAVRYGKTLAYLLRGISTPISPEDMLIGQVAERIPTEAEWQHAENMYRSWWAGKSDEELQREVLWFYSDGWLRCRPPWFYSFGHLALDWVVLIKEGLAGFHRRIEESRATHTDAERLQVLEGAALSHQAISAYILRYADAAEAAGRGQDADSLRHLSRGAPRTFREALQLLWLVTLVVQKVSGCGVLNYSRMDQYLLSLYRQDVSRGTLSQEEARALLQDFYLKNNEIMANTDHMSLDTTSTTQTLEVTFDDPNYIILGGLLSDGSSGVNELSYLMVQVAHDLKLKNPFVVVRYHDGIEDGFLRAVAHAMRDNATVILYNDDRMIPALRACHIEEPELYDYGFFGCNDPIIPAEEGGLRQLWLNLVRPLELALNQGDCPLAPGGQNRDPHVFPLRDRMTGLMTGNYYGIKTPPLADMNSMEDVLAAYRAQINYLMQEYRLGIEGDIRLEQEVNAGRLRIEDCFLQGTIRDAITWNNGGTKYHHFVVQGTGIGTVADALHAIDTLVFQEKSMTLNQLNQILLDNWEGHEALRQRVRRLPKYGNDIDAVDQYVAWASDAFVDAVAQQDQGKYLYGFYPTLSSDRDFTTMGKDVGATADGRRQRDPISENQSPAEGADISGVTALLNSVAKIRFERIAGGPLNLRLYPSAVSGEQGIDILTALLKTYLQKGGLQVQMNVVDHQTLRAAQKEPDKYRSLCVRVTGYSAFFTQMGPKAQEELIRRTEQAL